MRPTAPRKSPIDEALARRLRRRLLGTFLVASALAGVQIAGAAPESYGSRQSPLALSPEYGDIAFSDPGTGTGTMVVSTREGVEVRPENAPAGAPIGVYRAPGEVLGMALRGTRAYLFLGDQGIAALDLTTPSSPVLATTAAAPRPVRMGAILSDGSCVTAGDSSVHVYRLESGGALSLLETISYSDGRVVQRVRAQGDSILVVAGRPGAIPRLYVTVYRLPAGAASATKLVEWISNGRGGSGAVDAVWSPPMAFISDGSAGIYPLDTATGVYGATVPYGNSQFVRALGVSGADLFAIGDAATLQRYARSGAQGETLQPQGIETLELEPTAVAVDGARAVVTTRDDIAPIDPDESGRSQIEFPLSSSVPQAPTPPIGHIGRSRRVVVDRGLAYVADYTGGLRIYRAGGSDTTLVGVLPPTVNGRPVDLALDAADSLLYLASGAGGLEVVRVADPASPQRLASLALPGLASAVAIVDANTVAVARRGGLDAGVTFVDVSTPTAPIPRGSVGSAFVVDPRALAARDTILFVADQQLGVFSIRCGNPDAPATIGVPSGSSARGLDLQGTILLVATASRGVQVVDVFQPTAPLLRSEVPLPPVLGVARNGSMAVACLGKEGVALIDVSAPSAASLRSIVPAAGSPRDAAWVGDSLLVAGGTSIDRFLLAPQSPSSGVLSIAIDVVSVLPRASISWTVGDAAGQAGWNLYRETGPPTGGSRTPGGVRVNATLLPPAARAAVDGALVPGTVNRYRLEAVYEDGRLFTVAEGSVMAPSGPRLGRPYPNPFRAEDGGIVLPYLAATGGGTVTLRVVDVRGRLVRETRSAGPPAGGFGSIAWDGRNQDGRRVPSGVYYLYVRGLGIDDARSIVHIR